MQGFKKHIASRKPLLIFASVYLLPSITMINFLYAFSEILSIHVNIFLNNDLYLVFLKIYFRHCSISLPKVLT